MYYEYDLSVRERVMPAGKTGSRDQAATFALAWIGKNDFEKE
jgi:hypothetical protein